MNDMERHTPLLNAVQAYRAKHDLSSIYEGVCGGNAEWAYWGLFVNWPDPPFGPDWDAPKYRAKPVLIATYRADGSIQVEETEDAKRYLRRTQTA